MDRYQRVEKARQDTPINENEIRITTQGKMRNYITYAISTLQDKGTPEIVLKAMGRAINKTVNIAEIIKRRVAGLHQDTSIGSTDITDTWEPLEEGLVPLEQVRHVSMITIVLSVKELDATSTGYQPPLPPELVKPMADFNEEREGSPQGVRGRGRGRGRWRGYGRSQGRGRGRGNFESGGEFNGFDGGYARGRGRGWGRGNRGFGFRGRGRGFGGGADMPPDVVGYDDVNAAPVEDFSFGRGRVRGRNRGRGRGRGRGQGRGFQGGV